MKIVCNSSVLIVLEKVDVLSILRELFKDIFIPLAVKREVFREEEPPAWIKCQEISQPLASKVLEGSLEAGEREAICLYEELEADLLVIDDLEGRRVAERLGAKITGTLGILLLAKEKGIIDKVEPFLKKIVEDGFRISENLYESILVIANEE